MTLADVLPTIQTLSRADRLQLVQVIVADLAKEEGIASSMKNQEFPIWSPYDSYEAAAIMEKALNEHRGVD